MWQGSDMEASEKVKKHGGEHLVPGSLQLATRAAEAKSWPGHVTKGVVLTIRMIVWVTL